MSPVFKSVSEYRNTLKKRAQRMNKLKTVTQAGKMVKKRQLKLAPHSTGETKRNLVGFKSGKNQYTIISDVRPKGSKGFKQNMWTNRTPPHMKIVPRWSKGRIVIYGDGSHRMTGTPGWFDLGVQMGMKLYPRLVFKEVHKIMGMK